MKQLNNTIKCRAYASTVSKGFSLIELMVVIGIIAIVLVIALPNFAGMQQRARIRASVQQIAQDIRQIRERALATGQSYQVSFPPSHKEYVVTDHLGTATPYRLAGASRFEGIGASGPPESNGAPPANGIDFPPNGILILDGRGGAAPNGVIYVTNGRENFAIGINRLGKVRIYLYDPVSGGWN